MNVAVVIPARFASSRFPGKLLAPINGIPLIQRVWSRAGDSRAANRILVATDDERIKRTIESAGGEVILSSAVYRTGTDRIAGAAPEIKADAYLNLQGDELISDGRILDELIERFKTSRTVQMGTLMQQGDNADDWSNPNVVKVVTDSKGQALYFSRAGIPAHKSGPPFDSGRPPDFFKHLGIYIYSAETLEKLRNLPEGNLEKTESLEQLRALENGIPIRVWKTEFPSARIDSPEDLLEAEKMLQTPEPERSRTGRG
ncbi:MAG TPA: 3-deoxy-manno-octulosonate cytidylyltransferase [Nitrospiria bacterium]